MKVKLFAVAALVGGLAGSAAAQSQSPPKGLSFGTTAGYTVLDGDDFRDGNGGPRFQAFLRLTTAGGFAITAGGLYESHRLAGQSQRANFTGVYLEPRLVVRLPPNSVSLFLGAHGAMLKESIGIIGLSSTATGFGVGGVGGAQFQIGRHVGFETGATLNLISFGDTHFNGAAAPNTATHGMSLGLYTGIVVSLGG